MDVCCRWNGLKWSFESDAKPVREPTTVWQQQSAPATVVWTSAIDRTVPTLTLELRAQKTPPVPLPIRATIAAAAASSASSTSQKPTVIGSYELDLGAFWLQPLPVQSPVATVWLDIPIGTTTPQVANAPTSLLCFPSGCVRLLVGIDFRSIAATVSVPKSPRVASVVDGELAITLVSVTGMPPSAGGYHVALTCVDTTVVSSR